MKIRLVTHTIDGSRGATASRPVGLEIDVDAGQVTAPAADGTVTVAIQNLLSFRVQTGYHETAWSNPEDVPAGLAVTKRPLPQGGYEWVHADYESTLDCDSIPHALIGILGEIEIRNVEELAGQ